MHRHLGVWWRGVATATLLLAPMRAPRGATAGPALDSPLPIAMIVHDPRSAAIAYGVDAVDQVVRSADGGRTWSVIFSPGDPLAADPAVPGACLPGNYAHVTFLALDPGRPLGLYVGTEGALGDDQDNGCGNAPGGLFYRATGSAAFLPLNRGLPASRDARGDMAWGVRAITVAPLHPRTLYLATDPQFRAAATGAGAGIAAEPGLYRSTDGGLHWQPAFAGIVGSACHPAICRYPGSLAIDPTLPGLLLYASDTGLYRSIDGGGHWAVQATLDVGEPTHILARIDPYHPSHAYIVTDRAIYRTGDSGLHLARLSGPELPAASAVVDLLFEPGRPDAVVFLLRGGGRARVLDSPSAARSGGPGGTATAPTAAASPVAAATPTAIASPPPAPSAVRRSGALASGWPMAGHDPGQSFASPNDVFAAASLTRLGLRWERMGASPVIALAGKVYAIEASSGRVTAYTAHDGVIAHRYRSTGVQGLAAASGSLYFNRGSEIRIVDAATGAWHYTAMATGLKGVAGSIGPIIPSGSSLFAGVGQQAGVAGGRVYAFDMRTGRLLWARPSAASSIPCLAVGTLFLSAGPLGAGDSYLIDPATGAVRRTLKRYGTAQWHTSGDRIYAGVLRGATGHLSASIDAYDTQGRYRWTVRGISFGAASASLVVTVGQGVVEGLRAADGHRLWQVPIAGVQPRASGGGVLIAGRLVIAQSSDGGITVLDSSSGHVLRTLRPPSPGTNATDLIASDGMIYESVTDTGPSGVPTPLLLAYGV